MNLNRGVTIDKKNKIFLAVVVLVIFIAWRIYDQDPPSFSGETQQLTPLQVIEAFYHSINTLDFQTMENSVIGEAGEAEIEKVMQMHVVVKMRKAYSPGASLVIADQWEQAGRPKLQPQQRIYGIAKLKIEEISTEDPSIFIVTYEKWTPRGIKTTEQSNPLETSHVVSVTDKVTLKQDKGEWRIFKIEQSY